MPSIETKVLVVDDDLYLRRAVALIVQLEGYGTETAADGVQALKALEREVPDVILLDMMMPVMDGWEFIRLAQEKYGTRLPPVIVMTAGENPAARAAELGAQGWLVRHRRSAEHGSASDAGECAVMKASPLRLQRRKRSTM